MTNTELKDLAQQLTNENEDFKTEVARLSAENGELLERVESLMGEAEALKLAVSQSQQTKPTQQKAIMVLAV